MKKHILRIVFAIATVVALLGLYFLINGSLEMVPTQEQMEKARIAGGMLLLLGIIVDGVVLVKK